MQLVQVLFGIFTVLVYFFHVVGSASLMPASSGSGIAGTRSVGQTLLAAFCVCAEVGSTVPPLLVSVQSPGPFSANRNSNAPTWFTVSNHEIVRLPAAVNCVCTGVAGMVP